MTELIVFDFDGTLSDSKRSIVLTFQQACRDLGQPVPPADVVAPLIGLPLVEMFPRSIPHALTAAQVDALAQAYRDVYVAIDLQHTRLFDGVEALLGSLSHRRLAIATSKSQRGAEASVTRAGLREHFELVVGHDSVARPKPNPDMLEFILDRAGVAPERAVMVGDTSFDLEMADSAGVRAIGVGWGMHGASGLSRWQVVGSMGELGAALR